MKSLLEFLKRIYTRLEQWLERRLEAQAKATEPPKETADDLQDGEGEISAPEKKGPILRVMAEPYRMVVSCKNCGFEHELWAVCHVCGAPLCRDEEHCSKRAHDLILDREVICCPTHAWTEYQDEKPNVAY
ncbi:MAG: hypothetical protein MUC85_06915 [Anaerolineales bacterium]|jgi:predicted nucleic-acid-binding Zn-ribbon protein|nr:hypothetical protein [Anaerolineales bacterium]